MKLYRMHSERLLSCHPKKTCFVILGNTKYKEQIRKELEVSPLRFGEFEMKEKEQDA